MTNKVLINMHNYTLRLTAILLLGIAILSCPSTAQTTSVATPDGYATGTIGGGQATPVTVTTASAFVSIVKNSRPAVIIVKGRLAVGGIRIGSNKTILGADSSSGLEGLVRVRGDNCIFQNLIFGPSDSDAVELSGATRIFLHKCEFYDGADALLDIVRQSDRVTVSWCKFYYVDQLEHREVTLVGNGVIEDAGKLHVTMHHNWYAEGCHSVMPMVRYGQVHIYNNYYNSAASEFCIGIGAHSRIRVENTVFDHVRGAWDDRDGVDNDGQMGRDGLMLINTATPLLAPNCFPVFTPPYDFAMDPVDQVKTQVMAGAGNVFDRGIEDHERPAVTGSGWDHGLLEVSENGRFLQFSDGQPFFWLGDTAWLLFQKLDREDTETYLEDRKQKGFNVIQAMVLHKLPATNAYGAQALDSNDPEKPNLTHDPNGYWNHIDYVVDRAAAKGIYVAMVPTWGGIVKSDHFSVTRARAYAKFLATRYRDRPNIIWLNGGDIQGDNYAEIWQALGQTLHEQDPNHLMTFHPFGRTQSSTWFHTEDWLDFNMFQSGHRRYDQIDPNDDPNTWKGEDNWRYVREDLAKIPAKPTLDGEPSYENIPQGLHDANEPYWQANDVRRYAYWSVFAGACGHTYGDNAVMQMHQPGSRRGSYGVRDVWTNALNDSGAGQMQYLKELILSRPYFERIHDSSLISGEPGEKYDRLMATRGKSYAFIYTYTGRTFNVVLGKLTGDTLNAHWFNPRNGEAIALGSMKNTGKASFDPPGEPAEGNDWVLVLDDVSQDFGKPSTLTVLSN